MSERDLLAAFRAWNRAKDGHEAARLALGNAIRAAIEGDMSQSDVARVLGWPRQRVSELLRG